VEIAVIGLWHLGSVTACCLARLGHTVTGIDEPQRVRGLADGRAPLFEPGLDDLLREGLAAGRLRFTADVADGIEACRAVIISYDTRVDDRDDVDLSAVTQAVEVAAPHLAPGALLLVHSQVPVGTCRWIRERLRRARPSDGLEVAYVPENLRLGQAIERFMRPDMLVVGAEADSAYAVVEEIFRGVETSQLRTDLPTAEMTKHAINAFLATSISFGNELANLAQSVGADATRVAAALRLDRRVGQAPVAPGMGFAGGTLARDVKVLRRIGEEANLTPYLLNAVLRVNEEQNVLPLRWLRDIYGALSGLRIGVLGLTYKPGTSTLRRSASVETVRRLVDEGVEVAAADPQADLAELSEAPPMRFTRDAYEAARGADALVVMTPWPEFRDLDYGRIRAAMRKPVALDMANSLDKSQMEALGYAYIGVGRGTPRRMERT
jgi:UDPglucose 6-dehydrogenase